MKNGRRPERISDRAGRVYIVLVPGVDKVDGELELVSSLGR
jgi:hypothetical protein